MRLSNVLIVYQKELRDMLRDPRTIFAMFVFPVIPFPLLTVGFGRFEQRMRQKAQAEAASVMVLGAEHAPKLVERIGKAAGLQVVPPSADYAQRISDKKLRAAIEIPAGFEQALESGTAPAAKLQIYYYLTEMRSETGARRLEEAVRDYRDSVVQRRLAARNIPVAILKPIEAKRENVATEEKVSGLKLGMLVPYMIILLCLTGAMHPGMDLTAGEKERGTLETILASAVGRGELVMGKFLLVLTASLTTAVTSLASFGLTTKFVGGMARGPESVPFNVGLKTMASLFLLVLPLAVLFSAAVFAVSLLAKSYKEAQSYVSPLVFVVILPAIGGMLPGVELNPKLALVPILNVSLTAREILTGNYPWGSILVVFFSTCAWAGAALLAAVKMFQREEVLFRT